MVTVVDASTFLGELAKGQRLDDRNLEAGEGDERSISDLLIDQVEFADVLLLNKTDLVSEQVAGTVEATLRRLNPAAELIRTSHGGVVELHEVLGTGLYDPQLAANAPGVGGGTRRRTHPRRRRSTAFGASPTGRTGRSTRPGSRSPRAN